MYGKGNKWKQRQRKRGAEEDVQLVANTLQQFMILGFPAMDVNPPAPNSCMHIMPINKYQYNNIRTNICGVRIFSKKEKTATTTY